MNSNDMLVISYLAGIAVFFFLISCFGWKEEKKQLFKFRAGIRIKPNPNRLLLQLGTIINLAGLSVSARTFMTVLIASHILGIGAGLALGYGSIAAAILSFVLPAAALGYLVSKTKRRQQALEGQIEPLLMSISSSLYGNPAIISAIQDAMKSADQPMKKELERVLNELEHGIETNRALTNLSKRIDSEVLALALSGIIICRDTGGNMSKMLEALVETARTRSILQGKICAMTSQQKTTAALVTAIPIIFIICAQVLNPDYKEYFTTPLGASVITYTIISVSLGFFWLNKMTNDLLKPGKC